MNEKNSIGKLKGIGEKTEALFHRIGVNTIGDLIRYYPRGYDIFEDPVPISQLEEGKTAAVTTRDLVSDTGVGKSAPADYHSLSERYNRYT